MSNYNVDTLENKIVVEAQEAIKSLQEIIGYVNQSKTAINSMKNATGLKSLDSQAKKTTSSLTKLQLVGKGLKNALNISGLIYGFKNIYGFLKSSAEKSIDYIETLNLFEVSMGKTLDQYGNLDNASSKYYTKALKFQNDLNEKFGTNIEETMRYQALYNQMAESMGINDDASYIISENLTKLGIDLASLFNRTEEDTMEALRAGVLAGQTKPLRNYGLDVTQQTLAPLASELGIKRSVKQLSQAEKMILRYIAVLRQASNAHGDFARTIESPANQLKVFRQQFTELKTAIGNLFQGLLGQILPYVNAVLMVIKELIKALAGLFGFEVSSSNSNLADTSGIEDLETGVSGVNSGLGSAVDKAKELKAQLMGFDEINNITTDTGSGGVGGGGGISSTGIDSKLLDAMKEYDNLMEKVKMKATDIRDKIMDWLGFTKVINPLTGEVTWKLRDGWTRLKAILTVLKAIGLLYLGTKVVKLIGNLKKLWDIIKGTTTSTSAFATGWRTLSGIFKNIGSSIGGTITYFKYYKALGASTGQAFAEASKQGLGMLSTTTKLVGGLTGLGVSLYGSYDAMRDYSEGTKTAGEATGQLALSIGGATASGALLGSVFPGIGTAVGAVIGAVLGLTTALAGYKSEEELVCERVQASIEERQKYRETLEAQRQAVQETVNSELAHVEYTEKLVEELDGLVEANGKVKEGYEARVSFILGELNSAYGTEYEMIDGTIQGYKDIKSNIYKVIEAKKAEIVLSANEAVYAEAIKNRTKLYIDLENAQSDATDAEEAYSNELAKHGLTLDDAKNKTTKYMVEIGKLGIVASQNLRETKEAYESSQQDLTNATTAYEKNNKTIIYWENLKTSVIEGNQEEINKNLKALTSGYETESGIQTATIAQQIREEKAYSEDLKNTLIANGKELNEETKKTLTAGLSTLGDNLVKRSETIETLGAEEIEGWKELASASQEVYNEKISQLDDDTRIILELIVGSLNTSSPEVIELFTRLASDSTEKYNEYISKLPTNTQNEINGMINKVDARVTDARDTFGKLGENSSKIFDEKLSRMPASAKKRIGETTGNVVEGLNSAVPKVDAASGNIRDIITQNMDGTFSINFGLKADYSGLKSKLQTLRKTLKNMSSVPLVGNVFGKYVNSLDSLIGQLSVAGYAEGGFPPTGELFMAREAGPELVGRIGNKTAVANNSQIVEAVSSGVYVAVAEAMNVNNNSGPIRISGKINGKELLQFTIDGINGIKQQTGECPIQVL